MFRFIILIDWIALLGKRRPMSMVILVGSIQHGTGICPMSNSEFWKEKYQTEISCSIWKNRQGCHVLWWKVISLTMSKAHQYVLDRNKARDIYRLKLVLDELSPKYLSTFWSRMSLQHIRQASICNSVSFWFKFGWFVSVRVYGRYRMTRAGLKSRFPQISSNVLHVVLCVVASNSMRDIWHRKIWKQNMQIFWPRPQLTCDWVIRYCSFKS